jgi:hypothetical protein
MFIRQRRVKGKNGTVYSYFGLVESRRTGGKVRQRLVFNMGTRPTIEECIRQEEWKVERFRANNAPEIVAEPCSRLESRIAFLRRVVTTKSAKRIFGDRQRSGRLPDSGMALPSC